MNGSRISLLYDFREEMRPLPTSIPVAHRQPAHQSPKLLDQLRDALRSRHYSRRAETTYCHWVKRFIFVGTVQELLGHSDVRTTMIYTYVLNRGGHGVRSPVDYL